MNHEIVLIFALNKIFPKGYPNIQSRSSWEIFQKTTSNLIISVIYQIKSCFAFLAPLIESHSKIKLNYRTHGSRLGWSELSSWHAPLRKICISPVLPSNSLSEREQRRLRRLLSMWHLLCPSSSFSASTRTQTPTLLPPWTGAPLQSVWHTPQKIPQSVHSSWEFHT